MGDCCSCLSGDQGPAEAPTQKTPLLGARSGTLSVSDTPVIATPPSSVTSARKHNPTPDHKEFETSIELVARVELKSLPIPTIEKSFQGQAQLYNEVVDSFRSLESDIREFKGYFVEETAGIPVFSQCVSLLRQRCGDAKLKLERKSKYYIEMTYNPKEVSEKCQGNPVESLLPLKHFTSACRHIRDILQRAPQVQSNISIILNDEEVLRRDVMKADLSSEEGVTAMKSFLDNISKLRQMAAGTDTIHRDAEKKFTELTAASRGFFTETEADETSSAVLT